MVGLGHNGSRQESVGVLGGFCGLQNCGIGREDNSCYALVIICIGLDPHCLLEHTDYHLLEHTFDTSLATSLVRTVLL